MSVSRCGMTGRTSGGKHRCFDNRNANILVSFRPENGSTRAQVSRDSNDDSSHYK